MKENWYSVVKEAKKEDDLFIRDPWEPVDSSFIIALAYYEGGGVLEIKMKNGKRYTFMGVPPKIYEEFKNAPSKGKFFNDIIKKKYVLN